MTITPDTPPAPSAYVLGYARVSTGHQSLDQQHDALTAFGVNSDRIYDDKLSGTSAKEDRPGLTALLRQVREGDVIVVVAVDRLGRTAAEVMTTVRELLDRGVIIKTLREGVDSSNPVGRAVMGTLASFAELELELQRERRAAAKAARQARGLAIGRPKRLKADQVRQAKQMQAGGEPIPEIAKVFNVSRATLYRALADSAVASEG